MAVSVRNLSKRFITRHSSHAAVQNVSFEVRDGALVALLGPSGSGKSTVLRMIAGLEQPDEGEILLNNEDVSSLPPQKRGVGFVFQSYALFRHMKVFDNIAFGLQVQKKSKGEIKDRVHELLELLSLQGLEHRYPHQLSGGQRQRIALARALATSPRVLLLDEPFGAIDAKIRQELREWLRRLHDEIHVTSLFVTHDQEEALEICDEIVVMNLGQIEQVGSPEEIYHHPKTEFVANFVGSMNILPGRVQNDQIYMGPYAFPRNHFSGFESGDDLRVFFRPQDIYVSKNLKAHALQAKIQRVSFLGINMKLEIEAENGIRFFAIIPQYVFEREGLTSGCDVSYQIEELSYVNPRESKEIRKFTVADYEI